MNYTPLGGTLAKWEGGKGSEPRPMKVSKQKFEENFEKIFGKKEPKKSEKTECDQKQ